MTLVVYGDVACPYSYLASQRVDRLRSLGVAVEWRAVEHDPRLPMTGRPTGPADAAELRDVARLTLPGETVPDAPPARVPNSFAATAALAEAVSDGVADALRPRLFAAVWNDGRNLSDGDAVRRIVVPVMGPDTPGTVAQRMVPPVPVRPMGDGLVDAAVRRQGGTISRIGGPVTTAAYRRMTDWRTAWRSNAAGTVPAAVDESGGWHVGVAALDLLARRLEALAPPAVPHPRRAALAHAVAV